MICGFPKNTFKIEEKQIQEIIENYTRESGVRDLKRNLQKILRHFSLKFCNENFSDDFKIEISSKVIRDILGISKNLNNFEN